MTFLGAEGPVRFERHAIDAFPKGYQVAVADVTGDGKPDVIALSTDADRVDGYENPSWKRRAIAACPKGIDVAPADFDRDGRVELAVASGFYFSESRRGGEIAILRFGPTADEPWIPRTIAVDPVVHRLRWGDLDGDGRLELIHAPIFGPGSDGARDPKPAHLWAFRPPARPFEEPWERWTIDETLTVLHGIWVEDLDGDGRDEILAASFEGIHLFDLASERRGSWSKTKISEGAAPRVDAPGSPRGSSEVAVGRLAGGARYIAAIEPWHGHEVAVYRPAAGRGAFGPGAPPWDRSVIDGTLVEGHALAVADLDGDGTDEIVAGWRGGGGGLVLYDPKDALASSFERSTIEPGLPVEGLAAADLDGDGRLDLVAIAGRKDALVWLENVGPRPPTQGR
mgnify:CR=1 FL=1